MNKKEVIKIAENPTKETYKNQPLNVGDVYKNEVGTYCIVLQDEQGVYIKKTSGVIHRLPEQKAGFNNAEFVANVIQDEQLMQMFVDCGIIQDDNEVVEEIVEEKPKKKATKKKEENVMKLNIYQKINLIRKKWSETNIEKEGKGKAGGGAKYDYYKPQQIIDFCLSAELEQNLYSRFTVDVENKMCCYQLINLDNTSEIEDVSCPFEVPRKMAASEAQQVGAAMTYHNRRLAMMMYKIEDNSKESVDVLDNVDYTKAESIAPVIPAPPIEIEPPTSLVMPSKNSPIENVTKTVQPPLNDNLATENVSTVPPIPTPPAQPVPPVQPVVEDEVPFDGGVVIGSDNIRPMSVEPQTPPVPPIPATPQTPMNSIESLY